MDRPSSISSFEARGRSAGAAARCAGGRAWAFCLALLAAGEIILHLLPASALFAFDQHAYGLNGHMDYVMVNRLLAAGAREDMLILGNSCAREAIAPALLGEEMRRHGADPGVIRNFACADADSPTMQALVRRISRRHLMPRLIIYAVTPRDLIERLSPAVDASYFLGPFDLEADDVAAPRAERRQFLGETLRMSLDRHLRTLWLRELVRAHDRRPGAARGGMTDWQRQTRDAAEAAESLAAHPVTVAEAREKIVALGGGKPYRLSAEAKAAAEEMVRLAQRDGCRVIILELPVARAILAAFSPGFYDEYVDFFAGLAQHTGARFIRLNELGVTFTDADMRDLSHANWSGAAKVTMALGKWLAEAQPLPNGQAPTKVEVRMPNVE